MTYLTWLTSSDEINKSWGEHGNNLEGSLCIHPALNWTGCDCIVMSCDIQNEISCIMRPKISCNLPSVFPIWSPGPLRIILCEWGRSRFTRLKLEVQMGSGQSDYQTREDLQDFNHYSLLLSSSASSLVSVMPNRLSLQATWHDFPFLFSSHLFWHSYLQKVTWYDYISHQSYLVW